MFAPSRADVRRFFFEAWGKYRSQAALEGLERTAVEIILLHPEHQALLDDPQRNLDRDFAPRERRRQSFPASVTASRDCRAAIDRPAARHQRCLSRTGQHRFGTRRVACAA
jgi:hypothetical protein